LSNCVPSITWHHGENSKTAVNESALAAVALLFQVAKRSVGFEFYRNCFFILYTQEGFASEVTEWRRPFVRLYFIFFYLCVLVSTNTYIKIKHNISLRTGT